MSTDRSGTHLRGIMVPDPRITASSLVSKTDATVPSDYTEAGPFTGRAVPGQDTNLVLRTSGSQSADGDVEVYTARAGGIGYDDAGFLWRDVAGGDTTSQYKGIDGIGLVTDFDPLLYTNSSEGANIRPDVIRLASGKLLAAYSVTTLGVVRMKRYDPDTSAWTDASLAPTGAGAGYLPGACAICQLTSGRVLAYVLAIDAQQVDVYWSDDDGDNWKPGGTRVLTIGVAEAPITEIRAAWSPENSEVLLLARWTNTGTAKATASQYASADLGTTLDRVVADWQAESASGDEILTVEVVSMLGGGFRVLYVTSPAAGNDNLEHVSLGSAYDPATSATAAEPNSAIDPALPDVAGWRDQDGRMYFIAADGTTGGESRLGAMYVSEDQGATWEKAVFSQGTHALHTGTTTTNRLTSYAAASVGGRVALVTRWTAAGSGYDPNSVAAIWYSGSSTHTAPASDYITAITGEDFRDVHYIGWGSQNNPGGVWFPAEVPTSVNWTGTGAGSEALVSSGRLEVTTAAAQTRYLSRSVPDDSSTAVFVDFEVELDDGDGDVNFERVAFTVVLGSAGVWDYEVRVFLSSTGYRVYDQNAGGFADTAVTFDLTTKGHIRLALDDGGNVRTWHGSGGHVREWTEGTTATGLTDGGGATNLIQWGHSGAGENVSRWSLVGYCFWPGPWSPTQQGKLAASWSNPADLHPRSYPNAPALVFDGVSIEAVSGPTWLRETHRIAAAYEHPIGNLLPSSAPSPSRDWRATADGAAYEMVWDLESEAGFSDSFYESSSIGCFLINSTVRTAKFQGWDGAAWQDVISLDASTGYASLPAVRKGRIIYADTGGSAPTGERWSPHMMHAGDSIQWSDGENPIVRRIAANAEGGWRSGSKLARLQLDPDQLSGSEAASATASIYRRNFGGVVHNVTATYRYVRLAIPAQKTWSGEYRIGQLVIGPVFVFGLQHGDGWAWERATNTELLTRDSGVRSSRVRGPRRRAVEISWSTQPQDTSRMWDSEPSPDYSTGVSGGDPVASLADTAYQVLGLVERTEGANVPVVYLSRITRGTGTHVYTMDLEWLYGRIVTESPSLDHVLGADGVSPVLRGNVIRIEEER